MVPTLDQLKRISKVEKWTPAITANAASVVVALEKYGDHPDIQLDMPHRIAHFIAQLSHESGGFRYDKEIWGNTPAQAKYDVRADLGNTPAKDGDGKLYMGRSGIQLTGKGNYKAFTAWARAMFGADVPDFVAEPEKINTDPWEGLVPIWFWTKGNSTGKSLNIYADENNLEMITRRINGGMNGFDDRVSYYVRAALVFLDYPVNAVVKFQEDTKLEADGIAGPQTRAMLHKKLAYMVSSQIKADQTINVKAAPVTQVKEVAVAPKGVDKPGSDIGKVVAAAVAGGAGQYVEPVLGTFGGLTPWIQGGLILIALGLVIWFVWGRQLMAMRAQTITSNIREKANDGLPV